MNLKFDEDNFNKRFNIKTKIPNDELFFSFRIRVLNLFSNIDCMVGCGGVNDFCQFWEFIGTMMIKN